MPRGDSSPSPSLLLGARASNAGDAYHELWALQAAMQLLVPNTELRAVTVEGIPSPAGSEYAYEGVDCGLLYGGTTLESASRVELVQLKYSTASPDRPWTIARLTASSSAKKDNSVIRTMAETYRHACDRKMDAADITVSLVSNQPVAQEVLNAIANGVSGDTEDSNCASLTKASGLSGEQLAGFFRALDFSKMRSKSRLQLSAFLGVLIAEVIGGSSDVYLMQLQQQMRNLMLPGREQEIITQGVLLSWFNVVSLESLFPAPPDLKPAEAPIARHPAIELLEATKGESTLLCLHGPGGCGKTTTLMQLPALLPPGSISVLFDCYGAGRYTFSNDRRHLPENAFLQIANDLSQAFETPLLIAKSSTNPATIRTFMDKVRRSATVLSDARLGAVLAILIDAADNSVSIAEAPGTASACFVWELTEADLNALPANVKIVISTRTARKDKLRLPRSGVHHVVCPAFTLEETAAFVRARAPHATEGWITEFHALSNGIPRVQNYSFAKGGASSEGVLDALRPKGKKLDTILRELFQEASKKAGGGVFYERCMSAMSILPAPIPLDHLANLTGSSSAAIADFVADVAPTLRIENGSVAIADEDVEDFIREEASRSAAPALGDICGYFAHIFRSDTYAAVYYCDFLAQAGRSAEIIPILERDLLPAGIADPIESREVQLRRLRLALGACRSRDKAVDAFKVLLLSAEAAKDEAALNDLLREETDLSVRFANASLMRSVLSDRDSYPMQGAILAQDAAKAAEAGDSISARERLGAYRHWMGRRKEAFEVDPEGFRTSWKIELKDVVAIGETVALLDGSAACYRDVLRWRSKFLRLQIALSLIPRLMARGHQNILADAYVKKLVPAPWSLLLAVPLALAGYKIDVELLADDLKALRRQHVPELHSRLSHEDGGWELSLLELLITACEIAVAKKVDHQLVLEILDLLSGRTMSGGKHVLVSEAAKIDFLLRTWILRQFLKNGKLNPQLFSDWIDPPTPPEVPIKGPAGNKKRAQSAQKSDTDFSRAITIVFPFYQSRLRLLTKELGQSSDKEDRLDGLSSEAYYLSREYYAKQYKQCMGRSAARLIHLEEPSAAQLYEQTAAIVEGREKSAFAYLLLPAWEGFLLRSQMHPILLEEISKRSTEVRKARVGARSKADALIKFSRIALNFSQRDAKALFEKVIETVQEIDREAITQIRFVGGLLERPGLFEDKAAKALAMRFAAFATDVALRLEGEDGFPWNELTTSLTKLAPSAALAALSQWQDEGLADTDATLSAAIAVIAKTSTDDLLVATALVTLVVQPSVELLGVLADIGAVAPMPIAELVFDALAFCSLTRFNGRQRLLAGRKVLEKSPRGLAEGANIARLREAVRFYAWLDEPAAPRTPITRTPAVRVPEGLDFVTERGIARAIELMKEQESERYTPLRSVLAAIQKQVTAPSGRVPYLNVVATLGDSLEVNDRAQAILSALQAWRDSPAVESWRRSVLPTIISQNIWSLSRWLGEYAGTLSELLDVACPDGQVRIGTVLSGLEDGPKGFSSQSLFGLAEILAPSLSLPEAKDLSEWYVDRLHGKTPSDIRCRYDADDLPDVFDEAVGRLLYAQMSDIDIRRRWRAAHCVRQLTSLRGAPTVLSLVSAYDRQAESSYRLAEAPFYWMAARLWVSITLARVAIENPSAAASCKTKFLQILEDEAFPHYLVRDYAKAALLSLRDAGAVLLSNAEVKLLGNTNLPHKRPKKPRKRSYRELGRLDRDDKRFKFDSMDTIPYWYSPLFRRFADMSSERFFQSLENWLVDEWKVDPEANWWAKEPRRARFQSAQMLSSHRQGGMPVFERYGTYLEWHAMFCALSEWLKTEPLAVPEWPSESLAHWADRWRPTEFPTWLTDRRSISPLDPTFVPTAGGNDRHWLRRIPIHEILAYVHGAGELGTIVVDGAMTIAHSKRETSVSISTALVDPDTAKGLLQTLQLADRYAFHLPFEDREDRNARFDEAPFILRPLVAYLDRETRFDDDDPFCNEVGSLGLSPATWLLEKYELTANGFPVSAWSKPATEVSFEYSAWSDFTKKRDDRYSRREEGTRGYQLTASRQMIGDIMEKENLDVIMKIEIERRLEKEYGPSSSWEEKDKRCATQKILILSRDGKIYGAEGYIGAWRQDRKVAGASIRARPASELDGEVSSRENDARRKSPRITKGRTG